MRLWKNLKEFWNKNLRPVMEPALRMFVKAKVEKELNRHK